MNSEVNYVKKSHEKETVAMIKRIMVGFLSLLMLFGGVFFNSMVTFAKESIQSSADSQSYDKALPSGLKYSELGQAIQNYIREHKSTTASVAISVFDNQHTIYQTYYGYTDIDNRIKSDEKSVYEWGSVTKLLVWVSVMQLWEQGKIDLNEDISSYLPERFLTKRNYNQPITMINLMNHNAGFAEIPTDLFLADADDIKELGEALKYTEPEQIYEPGTVEAYSNWGAALAGYIVERISGQSFSNYVHQNIFEPLGMEHTALSPKLDDNLWVQSQKNKLQRYTTDSVSLIPNSSYYIALYPAGMCTGTLSDFEIFAKALLSKDGQFCPLFKSSSTLHEMLSPTMYFNKTNVAQNCHGFWTVYLGVQVIGHGGNTAGCSSNLLIDPESGIGVVVMTNQKNEVNYNFNLMNLIYGKYKYDKSIYTIPDIESTKAVYINARTITKGCLSIYSFLCTKPDLKYTEDAYSHFWVFSNENGITKKSTSYVSAIKLSWGEYILQVVLVLLMVIAILYSLFTLVVGGGIINIIKAISRKRHKKQKEVLPFRKYNYIECGLILLFAINFTALVVKALHYTTWSAIRWQVIINGILAILMLAYVFLLIRKFKKIDCRKREKIKYVFTAIMGVIVVVNILYWEMYKFW